MTAVRIEQVDRLECTVEQHRWNFAENNAAETDARWAAAVALKPRLFNGRVLLSHRQAIETVAGERVFNAAFFETDFKNFMVSRDMGFPDPNVFNCFAMAALRGSDGAFLLGEMAAHTANAGQIYFPAGTPDLDDVKGTVVDLAGSVLRELEEETGLVPNEVAVPPGCAIVFEGQQIACMQIVEMAMTADAAKHRIEAELARQTNAELAHMYSVKTPADIRPDRMPGHTVAYLHHMLSGRTA